MKEKKYKKNKDQMLKNNDPEKNEPNITVQTINENSIKNEENIEDKGLSSLYKKSFKEK